MKKAKIGMLGLTFCMGTIELALIAGLTLWGEKGPPDPRQAADRPIVYAAYDGWGATDLMLMSADGSNKIVLLNGMDRPGYGNHDPRWSRDGKTVAFGRTDGGVIPQENGIFRIGGDGNGLCLLRPMSDTPWATSGDPEWSADGTFLVYSDDTGAGPRGLFLVDPACGAGGPALLTDPAASYRFMSWAPEGNRFAAVVTPWKEVDHDLLVFEMTRGENGPRAAKVVDLTASGPLAGAAFFGLDWARTSDRIVMGARLPGSERYDLWIADLSDPAHPYFIQLTNTPEISEQEPCWSPDDSEIVFVRGTAIYRMAAAPGSNPVHLASAAKGRGVLHYPDWRRN